MNTEKKIPHKINANFRRIRNIFSSHQFVVVETFFYTETNLF